ncbi:uncharacterized protein VP01_7g34 [Puccinia sorghi]|uniref:Uncharacterized protein n=1 Tax=Puccinia sorghi TaxID=27349 RepID=A0A0L6UAM2_9BASI|nr:uncharacterized protein VP01_7g34 [Puccinia sorghi]
MRNEGLRSVTCQLQCFTYLKNPYFQEYQLDTLADILRNLLDAYKAINEVEVYSRFEPFKRHCIEELHLVQGDPLLGPRKSRKKKAPTRDDSEYDNMHAYDSFLTPAELDAFEDGIFTEEQHDIINSRENAFIDTLFDFDLWEEKAPQQSIDEIIELDGADESNEAKTNWNPEELWVP